MNSMGMPASSRTSLSSTVWVFPAGRDPSSSRPVPVDIADVWCTIISPSFGNRVNVMSPLNGVSVKALGLEMAMPVFHAPGRYRVRKQQRARRRGNRERHHAVSGDVIHREIFSVASTMSGLSVGAIVTQTSTIPSSRGSIRSS